jgi:uncharacterized membrane protein
MNCPVCNTEVSPQQAFCNHCGSPLSSAASTPESATPPPTYSAPPAYTPPPGSLPPPSSAAAGLSDNAAAAIAYITIIPAIIFLILEPYNKIPFVRFNSIQCLGLAVASFILQICASVLHVIPFFGVFMAGLLHLGIVLLIFIAWLICIIKAAQGQWFKLPIIGDFAEKQARG